MGWGKSPPPILFFDVRITKGENTPSKIKIENMERQLSPLPDKKRARMNKRNEEGGNETIKHENISQGTHALRPDTMIADQKTQAVQSQQQGEENEEGEVAVANPNNATNAPPPGDDGNEGNININTEGPSQQSILNLRTAQTRYRDLMQTRAGLFSQKSKLDWEIQFGPKNGVATEKIL